MSYPASVEHLTLPRTKRRGRRTQHDQGQDPTDVHLNSSDQPQQSPNDAEISSKGSVGGVVLDFGREGGVSLEKNKKGWRWGWASHRLTDLMCTIGENAICLFPPTRVVQPDDKLVAPPGSIEASTKFIDSICEPYERYGLREAIASILSEPPQDAQDSGAGPSHTSKQRAGQQREVDIDDYVYRGRTLVMVHNPRARVARRVLAFPVGQVGHHLNISPLLTTSHVKVSKRSKIRFTPTHKAVERFPTPILQIVSSPVVSMSRIDREATTLLIRLQSTTHALNLIPDHSYIPPTSYPPVISQRVARLSYEDTEFRRHVDVALDPDTWSRALVVDEGGGVWLWWEEKETRDRLLEKVWNLRKIRAAVSTEKHQFFRVAFGTKPGTALVVSSREAVIIDIDNPEHPITPLFSLIGKDRVFTSLEKTACERNAPYTVLCTTHEVMWIDEVKPGAPVLSWRHDYGVADRRDLEVTVVPGIGQRDTCTILSSRSHPLQLAYHTTKHAPLRSLAHPYALSLPVNRLTSFLTVPPSLRQYQSLLGLSADGAIYSTSLYSDYGKLRDSTLDNPAKQLSDLRAIWDDEMRELAGPLNQEQETESSSYREMNFRWAWLEINRPLWLDDEQKTFSPMELERYLRELDAPLEHLMTTADLARDANHSEASKIRSHILTPLAVDSRSLDTTLETLDKADLTRHLPFATVLNPTVPAFQESRPPITAPDDASERKTATDMYRQLCEAFPSTDTSLRNRLDTAQLALDLTLSRTVLFSEPLEIPSSTSAHDILVEATQEEPDEMFARAAGKLSLQDREPAQIKYHVLTPRKFDSLDDDEPPGAAGSGLGKGGGAEEGDTLQGLSARGLLSDWTLGEDPSNWEWRAWRKGDDEGAGNEHGSGVANGYGSSGTPMRSQRLIKPLPSPRHSQLAQPTFPASQSVSTYIPSIGISSNAGTNTPNRYPLPLKATTSLPSLHSLPPALADGMSTSSSTDVGLGFGTSAPGEARRRERERERVNGHHRSSPPPMGTTMNGSSQPEETQWAATQVERGPHGGREKKKKAGKKRVGGF